MNPAATLQPPDFALHWARELDCKQASLVRLQGGINNRVFRCGEENRQQWVIKGYAPLEPGARDRMQAEVDFLHYAAQVAPGFTPELVHVDAERRCVVLENLQGVPFADRLPPSRQAIRNAIHFFRQLNHDFAHARMMIRVDAAEAYLNLNDHLENVCKRINAMQVNHLALEIRGSASGLLNNLTHRYNQVFLDLDNQIRRGLVPAILDRRDCCVSPSDFGFHNAIRTQQGTRFFDFEFAGWDDPAKAVVDFLLQPRVPVSRSAQELILRYLAKIQPSVANRVDLLMPILRLKWICIILSFLNPSRLKAMNDIEPSLHNSISFFERRLSDASSLLNAF